MTLLEGLVKKTKDEFNLLERETDEKIWPYVEKLNADIDRLYEKSKNENKPIYGELIKIKHFAVKELTSAGNGLRFVQVLTSTSFVWMIPFMASGLYIGMNQGELPSLKMLEYSISIGLLSGVATYSGLARLGKKRVSEYQEYAKKALAINESSTFSDLNRFNI